MQADAGKYVIREILQIENAIPSGDLRAAFYGSKIMMNGHYYDNVERINEEINELILFRYKNIDDTTGISIL